MQTTISTIPINGREVEHLISAFTLTCIGGRDAMTDESGVFSFFYGHSRPVRRIAIRQTAPDVYSVDFEHIDPQTRALVTDRIEHVVQAADLRATIRELA